MARAKTKKSRQPKIPPTYHLLTDFHGEEVTQERAIELIKEAFPDNFAGWMELMTTVGGQLHLTKPDERPMRTLFSCCEEWR